MNKCKSKYISRWEPAVKKTFKMGTGNPRDIIMNNYTIKVGSAMKIRVAEHYILDLCPVNL